MGSVWQQPNRCQNWHARSWPSSTDGLIPEILPTRGLTAHDLLLLLLRPPPAAPDGQDPPDDALAWERWTRDVERSRNCLPVPPARARIPLGENSYIVASRELIWWFPVLCWYFRIDPGFKNPPGVMTRVWDDSNTLTTRQTLKLLTAFGLGHEDQIRLKRFGLEPEFWDKLTTWRDQYKTPNSLFSASRLQQLLDNPSAVFASLPDNHQIPRRLWYPPVFAEAMALPPFTQTLRTIIPAINAATGLTARDLLKFIFDKQQRMTGSRRGDAIDVHSYARWKDNLYAYGARGLPPVPSRLAMTANGMVYTYEAFLWTIIIQWGLKLNAGGIPVPRWIIRTSRRGPVGPYMEDLLPFLVKLGVAQCDINAIKLGGLNIWFWQDLLDWQKPRGVRLLTGRDAALVTLYSQKNFAAFDKELPPDHRKPVKPVQPTVTPSASTSSESLPSVPITEDNNSSTTSPPALSTPPAEAASSSMSPSILTPDTSKRNGESSPATASISRQASPEIVYLGSSHPEHRPACSLSLDLAGLPSHPGNCKKELLATSDAVTASRPSATSAIASHSDQIIVTKRSTSPGSASNEPLAKRRRNFSISSHLSPALACAPSLPQQTAGNKGKGKAKVTFA